MKKIFSILIVTIFLITSFNIQSYTEEIDIKDLSLYKNKYVLIILKSNIVIKCKIIEVSNKVVVCIDNLKKINIIKLDEIDKVFLFEPKTKKNDRKNETKKKNYSSYKEMFELDFPLSDEEFKDAMDKTEQLTEKEKRMLFKYHDSEKVDAELVTLFNCLFLGLGIGNLYQGDYTAFAMCLGGDLLITYGIYVISKEQGDELMGSILFIIPGIILISASTFYMPYDFEDEIDNQLRILFNQNESYISELPKAKGFRSMISESDIDVKRGMNNKYKVSLPLIIIDF